MATTLTTAKIDLLNKDAFSFNEIRKNLETCLEHEIENTQEILFNISKQDDQQKEKPIQFLIKRIIDILGTCFGLVIISPLLIAVAIAIKIESRGSVLFKQKRIGKHGKEFYMYKFRSMYEDAEDRFEGLIKHNQTNDYMFKMFDDPRITKVGKFIRKYSIDELPQLINVIKGEMTLVGFRPPIQNEVDKYKDWHYLRFAGTPGLTGPWQVSGRSSIKNFDIIVELEYRYNKNWNILKDIEILLKTIPVVIYGKDAA